VRGSRHPAWPAQTDHDAAAGKTVWTYHAGAANGVRPHGVAGLRPPARETGAAEQTFAYDAAGNLTRNTTETGSAQILT